MGGILFGWEKFALNFSQNYWFWIPIQPNCCTILTSSSHTSLPLHVQFECFIALYSKWQIIPSSSYWIGNHFIDVFIIVFSSSNFFQQVVVLLTIQKCNVLRKPHVLAYTPVVTAVNSVGKRSRSSQSILPYSPGYLCRETAILLCSVLG